MIRWLRSRIAHTNPLRLAYHRTKAAVAAAWYGYPAKKLTVIGITGTDGKTTTVAMVSHILHHAGKKAGAVSSAFFEINGKRLPNPTQKTSPPAFVQQQFLHRLMHEGYDYAVLECSSHGLLQGRLRGIQPAVAAITNLSMEHLDYHGTMEEYLDAKAILFRSLNGKGTKVLNKHDQSYEKLKRMPSDQTIVYGTEEGDGDDISFSLTEPEGTTDSSTAQLLIGNESRKLTLYIPGTFNLANAVCAIACAHAIGIPVDRSIEALQSFKGAPGRLEKIDEGQNFSVFVDFTVTPVAYEKTLTCLRSMLPEGKRLLVLTGSCGDRMKEKRPIVGKICAKLADVVVVSNEDPYTEDPQKIIDEVFAGIDNALPALSEQEFSAPPHRAFAVKIFDRREAIRFLLRHANDGDIVIFCAKGGDVTMWTARGQVPWDEDKILREELRRLLVTRAR